MSDGFSGPPVYFYVPASGDVPEDLPRTPDEYWPWLSAQTQVKEWGKLDWTYLTFLNVRATGFPCQLVRRPPRRGLVIAHRTFLSSWMPPRRNRFLVCLLGDKGVDDVAGPHPFAQAHVVQNPFDAWVQSPTALWSAFHMPLWTQPGLIPRDPNRGERFENVAFFGNEPNVARELRTAAWSDRLREIGLNWRIVPRQQWHDYSDVDAVVAVRRFESWDYSHKPATKLHNCWLAGVPAIVGAESAYLANRTSPLDFLEATSVEEALACLGRLRDDPSLRRTMVQHGRMRAIEVAPQKMAEDWRALIENELIPAFDRWRHASIGHRSAYALQRAVWASRRTLRLGRRDAGYALERTRIRIGLRTRLRALLEGRPSRAG